MCLSTVFLIYFLFVCVRVYLCALCVLIDKKEEKRPKKNSFSYFVYTLKGEMGKQTKLNLWQ